MILYYWRSYRTFLLLLSLQAVKFVIDLHPFNCRLLLFFPLVIKLPNLIPINLLFNFLILLLKFLEFHTYQISLGKFTSFLVFYLYIDFVFILDLTILSLSFFTLLQHFHNRHILLTGALNLFNNHLTDILSWNFTRKSALRIAWLLQ